MCMCMRGYVLKRLDSRTAEGHLVHTQGGGLLQDAEEHQQHALNTWPASPPSCAIRRCRISSKSASILARLF